MKARLLGAVLGLTLLPVLSWASDAPKVSTATKRPNILFLMVDQMQGAGDRLAPNEVICPVCKVVIRSSRTLLPGDRVYCMPCMSRLVVMRDVRILYDERETPRSAAGDLKEALAA